MRRILVIAALLAASVAALAANASGDDSHTYFIEFDNAFGLVQGSEVKVAGVEQGTIQQLFIDSHKRAVVKVTLSGPLAVLGKDTVCSSEPQSLIAEYFIDCIPKGPPLTENTGSDDERKENPDIPVTQTRQTVQSDLVQDALRMPYRDRLSIIIDEFGTGLAGNAENLNSAIKRGAPALTAAHKVTSLLASQNRIISELNANSDEIVAKLNARSADVVRFIHNARETADVAASQRDNLSKNFGELDDFLAELQPTMAKLNRLAVTQTPLLQNLRVAAPGLNELSRNLPDFNRAAEPSVKTLGDAAKVGTLAFNHGRNEISQLAKSTKPAYSVADNLAKFLDDIDDPRRAVEIDSRVKQDTGRSNSTPGQKDTMGYTGMEGLLNYVFYQTGALTQFDQVSHLLHFSIFEVGTGPCANYNGEQTVPDKAGTGQTTDPNNINRCVSWLGPNQPGINSGPDLPPYDPSVCPDGSTDTTICNPAGASAAADRKAVSAGAGPKGGTTPSTDTGGTGGDSTTTSTDTTSTTSTTTDTTDSTTGTSGAGGSLGDVLGDAGKIGDSLGGITHKRNGKSSRSGSAAPPSSGADGAAAANDLLGYLLGN